MSQSTFTKPEDPLRLQGCRPVAAYVLFSLWIIILSAVDIFANWAIEQTLVQDSTTIPDVRWIIHGVIAVTLLISLVIAYFVTKAPRLKMSIKVWMLGTILAVLVAPAKKLFITQQQLVAVYEILAIGLISVVMLVFQKKDKPLDDFKRSHSTLVGVIVVLCAGFSIPWFLWGALGSIEDTLLYLILGACFAVFSLLVIFPNLLEQTQAPQRELKKSDLFLDGLTLMLFFLICVTGLAQNGSQIVLTIVLPISGWLVAGLGIMGRRSADRVKVGIGFVIGFLLALPLLWFDADELALVITGTPGETFEWANRAAFTTLGILIIMIVLSLIYFKLLERMIFSKQFNITVSLLAVLAVGAVYALWGRPGFYGDQIFVIMKNQADLTQVNQIADLTQRRKAVYATLVKTANESQAGIRKQLDEWHVSYTPYYLVDGLEVNAGDYQQLVLQKRSDVDRILPSPQLRPLPRKIPLTNSHEVSQPSEPSWNLKMIEVDKVRQELGITGKGIVIGQTDSGVDGYHPEVKSSYRGEQGSDDYNWLDPWNHTLYPADVEGHGTATLALITGKNIGIAPDAEWIGCVNLARNLGNPAVYLNCMQFMLAPYPQKGNSFTDGVPAKGAMIVNNSWGCPAVEGCDAKTFQSAVKAMETAGIFMSVAAGNTGDYGCSTITDPPAIYADVMTVGSINEVGNVSSFSSLGPVSVDGSNRVKPDLLAPGEGIVSAFPDNAYTQADGTSFSAPHLSGVVALMWSANPKLIGNIPLTKQILDQTATPYTGQFPSCVTDQAIPNDAAGYGILNAYAAVKAALAVK